MTVEGIPESGLELLASGADGFSSEMRRNFTDAEICELLAAEPLWIILRNASPQAVIAAVVRFTGTGGSGQPLAVSVFWLTAQDLEHRKLHPGESLLIGPCSGAAKILRGAGSRGVSAGTGASAAGSKDFMAAGVSLDAAVFEDGTLVGPDTAGLENRLRECLRAERELYTVAGGLPPGERRAYLQSAAGQAEPLDPEDAIAAYRAVTARIMLNLLDNAPSEEQFLRWLDQVFGHPVPEPRRPA
jgi:hypothetical protein